jgi:hypothetical protein
MVAKKTAKVRKAPGPQAVADAFGILSHDMHTLRRSVCDSLDDINKELARTRDAVKANAVALSKMADEVSVLTQMLEELRAGIQQNTEATLRTTQAPRLRVV